MTLVEVRGNEFIISDVYPTLEIFPVITTINICMHAIYPIMPTRAIVLNHIIFRKNMDKNNPLYGPMISISKLKGNILKEPKNEYPQGPLAHTPDDEFCYIPVKIYQNDIAYINMLFLNEARVGFAFRNKNKVIDSIKKYNSENRQYNKNNFDFLETQIDEREDDK